MERPINEDKKIYWKNFWICWKRFQQKSKKFIMTKSKKTIYGTTTPEEEELTEEGIDLLVPLGK